ncbi:hypothetical protein [Desulfobacula sp.]|uniref:hypothetical protein n=1 Tax=Desulfobacula sp. TaxID=2593537 RepID=UPI00262541A5|nr:hypothetical protein [Desulfobacula sp.]
MASPLICFFLSGEEKQVLPGSRLWKLPLSGKGMDSSSDIPCDPIPREPVITIGDYFSAAGRFLSENDFSILKTGIEALVKQPVLTDQIDRISVFLEKHGAFYHPLKIQVAVHGSSPCSFVLNGAISIPGLALIEKEYHLISGLNITYANRYLPLVFGVDVIKTEKGKIGFFLGEWFDGYKEFHATVDQGTRQIVIWESDGTGHTISETNALPIYQEISRILTYYYDLETFEQIFPWHHAAGDFIVRQKADTMSVRMITVRGYAPLTEFSAADSDKKANILPSLMFFCLNLTLRMRLDRLNGTGQDVMLGDKTIPAVVHGFLQALDEKSMVYDYGELRVSFLAFVRQFSLEQMMGLMAAILDSHHPVPAEMRLIEKMLVSHCTILHAVFKSL